MTVTTTYTITFGLFTPDGDAVSEDAWNNFLIEEVCPVFQSFSIREELGFWQGEPEPIRVLTFISAFHEDGIAVYGIAKAYRDRFGQDAVLVNSYTSFTDLI